MKRWLAEAMGCLENPPGDARSWFKIVGAVTLFSLLWGLMICQLILHTYALKSPEATWFFPSATYLVNEAWNAVGETAFLLWWPISLAVLLSGRKRVGLLLVVALPFSLYYAYGHFDMFLGFAGPGMAALWATLLQGVLLFVWGLLFIKCADEKSMFQLKPLAVVALSHFFYNVFINRLLAVCS